MTYDYYYGYLYRNVHILLATIINILLLIHIFKGLLYNNLSNQIYIHYSGYVLYLLLIIISYLGYILTYGQLSYWGATVIINLLPVSLATLILGNYNISAITINRYLIFHIILTLVLYVFIIIHMFYLHQLSSQSPLPVSILSSPASQLNITFQHFILKDVSSLIFLLFIFMSIALFILLNLSHSNNLIPINPLSTPQHIIPEWYFLYLYSILKIIPSKMGGILTVVITILILLLLTTTNYSYNLYNTNSISISNYTNIDTVMTIFLSYVYLSYIGLQLPIAPYLINLRYFLLYLPIPIIIINLLSTIPINTLINTFINTFRVIHLNTLSTLSTFTTFTKTIFTRTIFTKTTFNYISLLSTTNHKRIGLYYLLTGSYIAILGILLSIIIRIELYSPSNTIINMSNVSFYNYTITNHGLLMLLFIVMPILFGAYGNYLLVLTVGLIDIVFPRINNFGWLLLLLSYFLIQFGILTEYLTGTGWTLYPPLSTITSTYIISTLYLALAISGVSSLLTSVNYLLLMPYMLHVTDLLLISFFITSLMIIYTMPVLSGAFLLATSDILLSTSYFSSYGDPVLYAHLFWWLNDSSLNLDSIHNLLVTYFLTLKSFLIMADFIIIIYFIILISFLIIILICNFICFIFFFIFILFIKVYETSYSRPLTISLCAYTSLDIYILLLSLSVDLFFKELCLISIHKIELQLMNLIAKIVRLGLLAANNPLLFLQLNLLEEFRKETENNEVESSETFENEETLSKDTSENTIEDTIEVPIEEPIKEIMLDAYAGSQTYAGFPQLTSPRPNHRYPFEDPTEFGYFLAGLIDGNGHIYVHEVNKRYQIRIIFHKKDKALMLKLTAYFKDGSVTVYGNHYSLTFGNQTVITRIINLIHNKLRISFLIDKMNALLVIFKIPLPLSVADTSNLLESHYLAGFIDAHGSFEIRASLKSTQKANGHVSVMRRVHIRLRVGLNIRDQHIIQSIQECFGGHIYSVTSQGKTGLSTNKHYATTSMPGFFKVLQYIEKYHLCSQKYLEYILCLEAYKIIQNGQHRTEEGLATLNIYKRKISELKHNYFPLENSSVTLKDLL